MRVKITNRRRFPMRIESRPPLKGRVEIRQHETAEVELAEIPTGIKTLADRGWAVIEIVSEKKASKGAKKQMAPAKDPIESKDGTASLASTNIPKSSE